MIEKWAAEITADLRLLGVTQKELAKRCNYSEAYVCQVLCGKKYSTQAKNTIISTLAEMKNEAARL